MNCPNTIVNNGGFVTETNNMKHCSFASYQSALEKRKALYTEVKGRRGLLFSCVGSLRSLLVRLLALSWFFSLLGQKYGLNVGQHTTLSDGDTT